MKHDLARLPDRGLGRAYAEYDDHATGLVQGMFERNALTFNPGWDGNAQRVAAFTDVRELQRQLNARRCAW